MWKIHEFYVVFHIGFLWFTTGEKCGLPHFESENESEK